MMCEICNTKICDEEYEFIGYRRYIHKKCEKFGGQKMKTHKHKGAVKMHPVTRVHKDPVTKRAHKVVINSEYGKRATTRKPVMQQQIKKTGLKQRVGRTKRSDDHGSAPSNIDTYEPVVDFNPSNPPADYIIVKVNHELLDDMLQKFTRKSGAIAVGFPCERV